MVGEGPYVDQALYKKLVTMNSSKYNDNTVEYMEDYIDTSSMLIQRGFIILPYQSWM